MSEECDSIAGVFSNRDYCFAEIARIREIIGQKTAPLNAFDAASQSLAFMRAYCPNEIKPIVEAQAMETERRRLLSLSHP